jgi:hypothetical protein
MLASQSIERYDVDMKRTCWSVSQHMGEPELHWPLPRTPERVQSPPRTPLRRLVGSELEPPQQATFWVLLEQYGESWPPEPPEPEPEPPEPLPEPEP